MIVFTGGGTGGHIFPCLAIIDELKKRGYKAFVWIGEKKGKEKEWAVRSSVPFYGIRTGKLRRYFSLKNAVDVFSVIIGFLQSLFLFMKLKPDLVFSKGGFVAVSPVLAARLLGIPIITHESDINPGLATRIISRFASIICVSFDYTAQYFPGKNVVFSGNPVRGIIKKGDQSSGFSFLDIQEKLPVVTVIGGSLGASSINRAVWKMLDRGKLPFYLVHQSGAENFRTDIGYDTRYRQFAFINEEMGDVLAASDLVVSRAGAGALYEVGCMKKPCILIPLPKSASRGEQIENAKYFEARGAAVIIPNEELDDKKLLGTIEQLLSDMDKMKRMGENAYALCKTDAAVTISDSIESLLK